MVSVQGGDRVLLERLVQKQQELAESDRDFARRLGVPSGTWSPTRCGYKPAGARIARAAMAAFPGDAAIYAAALATLLTESSERQEEGSESNCSGAR